MSRSYANDRSLVTCAQCPRLVQWREEVAAAKRRAYAHWVYWGKPVPNFGDPDATRLIVGLAPAAHGANRTGRMFTGDSSGEWLFRALHKAGVANRLVSDSRDDGLELRGVLITAIVHCAPPDNKPTPPEIANCRPYLVELLTSKRWESILCLGAVAWNEVARVFGERPRPPFHHGAVHESGAGPALVASYHPSRQNTFTRKLTEPMLDDAVRSWLSR